MQHLVEEAVVLRASAEDKIAARDQRPEGDPYTPRERDAVDEAMRRLEAGRGG